MKCIQTLPHHESPFTDILALSQSVYVFAPFLQFECDLRVIVMLFALCQITAVINGQIHPRSVRAPKDTECAPLSAISAAICRLVAVGGVPSSLNRKGVKPQPLRTPTNE